MSERQPYCPDCGWRMQRCLPCNGWTCDRCGVCRVGDPPESAYQAAREALKAVDGETETE